MPKFRYRVRDRKGRSFSGEMEAETAQAVSEQLSQQGYYPISVSRTQTIQVSLGNFGSGVQPKMSSEDLSVFTRQLWSLQKAGLPLLTGLSSLKEQAAKPSVREMIKRLMADLEKGESLSEAFTHHPKSFRPIYVHMVKAGEASGKLEEVMLQLSDMERFERETRDRIRSATMYPIIAFVGIIVAFLVVITMVIPKFSDLFSRFGADLPFSTRMLLKINDILHHNLLETFAVIGLLFFLFRVWKATDGGRRRWDFIKLKFPVFGLLFFNLQMARFARVLSDLLKSGVPILQALELVGETMTNVIIRNAIFRVKASVNEGKGMSAPMKATKLFAPLVIQMVEVGEQTGRTDELLIYVAEYYQDQANMMIKNLSVLIEPMLLTILGAMILLLAAGVFTPMWNLVNVVRG